MTRGGYGVKQAWILSHKLEPFRSECWERGIFTVEKSAAASASGSPTGARRRGGVTSLPRMRETETPLHRKRAAPPRLGRIVPDQASRAGIAKRGRAGHDGRR